MSVNTEQVFGVVMMTSQQVSMVSTRVCPLRHLAQSTTSPSSSPPVENFWIVSSQRASLPSTMPSPSSALSSSYAWLAPLLVLSFGPLTGTSYQKSIPGVLRLSCKNDLNVKTIMDLKAVFCLLLLLML